MTNLPINQVIQGDCLEVMRGFSDASIDLILTDPPYGHNNNNNGDLISRWEEALGKGESPKEEYRPIANDGVEANDLFRAFLVEARRLLMPGCCCCCCCGGGGGGPDPQFARWSLWMDEVLEFKQMVVWDKGPMGMGWHYRRSYETVLVAYKPGAAVRWYDTTKRVENIIRPVGKIIPQKDDHPTLKPVRLMEFFIRLHSKEGDIVLDPFAGSGTTLVAAKRLNRRYIGIEIDGKWAEEARGRIADPVNVSMFESREVPK